MSSASIIRTRLGSGEKTTSMAKQEVLFSFLETRFLERVGFWSWRSGDMNKETKCWIKREWPTQMTESEDLSRKMEEIRSKYLLLRASLDSEVINLDHQVELQRLESTPERISESYWRSSRSLKQECSCFNARLGIFAPYSFPTVSNPPSFLISRKEGSKMIGLER